MTIEEYLSIDKMLKGQEEDQLLALAIIEKPDVDLFTTMFIFRTNEVLLRKNHEKYPGIISKIITVYNPKEYSTIKMNELYSLVEKPEHKVLFKYVLEEMVVSTIKLATGISITPHFIIEYNEQR
jgi:hypothetical protein